MHHLITGTALAAVLVLAAPTWAASAADCRTQEVEGSDRGTFTTSVLDATHVLTADRAVGHARHVGRYTLEATEVIDLGSPTLDVTEGAFTITTASGAMTGSYAGNAASTSDPAVITYHAAGPVLGGSGRFAGVTGWLVFDGVANLVSGELCDRVSGWISTSGSGVVRRRQGVTNERGTESCRL